MLKIAVLDDYAGVALDCADWDSLGGDAHSRRRFAEDPARV